MRKLTFGVFIGILSVMGLTWGVIRPLTDYSLPQLKNPPLIVENWDGLPHLGTPLPAEGALPRRLQVENFHESLTRYPLATFAFPQVLPTRWVLYTAARFQLDGRAFLEAVYEFPNGLIIQRADSLLGVMGELRGHRFRDRFREINLPFDAQGHRPLRMTVNLVFEGRGLIELQPLQLFEGWPSEIRRIWFSETTALRIYQTVAFTLAAMGGLLAGLHLGGPRYLWAMRVVCAVGFGVGLGLFALGGGGALYNQPVTMWQPFALLGFAAWTSLAMIAQFLRRKAENEPIQ